MAIGSTITVNFISTVVIIFVNAFALWLTADKFLKCSNKGFRTALSVAITAGVISFILSLIPTFVPTLIGNTAINLVFFIVNAGVLYYLISNNYKMSRGETVSTWLLVIVISFLLGFVLGNILGFIAPIVGL